MRQTGEMIGKLDRDQRSGVRCKKSKDLEAVWRRDFGVEGLDSGGQRKTVVSG